MMAHLYLKRTRMGLATVLFGIVSQAISGQPVLEDDRLELTLFAEEPDIVTPIGITVDSKDRVFVLESHTHSPPSDYDGPDGDIVKVFEDGDGDGTPDKVWNFAEGIHAGMNMAFSPGGVLYVAAAFEVIAFYDHDGDGVSDERKSIVKLNTESTYPHSAQLGISFSTDGWVYVCRGNIGSHAYTINGSDGAELSGYGDGGTAYRFRPDGSQLQHVATGFWNLIHLKFDTYGRLLAVDNDPDARGPNLRLELWHGGMGSFSPAFSAIKGDRSHFPKLVLEVGTVAAFPRGKITPEVASICRE